MPKEKDRQTADRVRDAVLERLQLDAETSEEEVYRLIDEEVLRVAAREGLTLEEQHLPRAAGAGRPAGDPGGRLHHRDHGERSGADLRGAGRPPLPPPGALFFAGKTAGRGAKDRGLVQPGGERGVAHRGRKTSGRGARQRRDGPGGAGGAHRHHPPLSGRAALHGGPFGTGRALRRHGGVSGGAR